jgi:hypothetical protein
MNGMGEGHRPTDNQRKQALVTGLVLAALAVGVYLVVIFRVFTRG